MGDLRVIPTWPESSIGDFRGHPGCPLLLRCQACGWSKTYDPERVVHRLEELRGGNHASRLGDVARPIGWLAGACDGEAGW